jgi:hypothetical protein
MLACTIGFVGCFGEWQRPTAVENRGVLINAAGWLPPSRRTREQVVTGKYRLRSESGRLECCALYVDHGSYPFEALKCAAYSTP